MTIDLREEATAFNEFIQHRLEGANLSLEESLRRFRQYQRELRDLRQKLQVAEDQSAAGQSRPLDIDATIGNVRERLAQEGITE